MIVSLVLLCTTAHLPTIKEERIRLIRNIGDSQVFYSRGGTRQYKWHCVNGDRVFWEIYVPNTFRPDIKVGIYGHSDNIESQLTYSGSVDAVFNATTIKVDACPFRSHYEAFTQLAYRTVVRYGSAVCDRDGYQHVEITATGPNAFSIGERETFKFKHYAAMTYYYLATGTWAGFPCPGTTFLVFGLFVISSNLISKFAKTSTPTPNRAYFVLAETLLVMLWLVSIISDGLRYLAMQKIGDCVPLHDNANGAQRHSSSNTKTGATGLFAVRMATAIAAITAIIVAGKAPGSSSYKIALIGCWVASTFIFVACLLLGIGYGASPLSLIGWVAYQHYCTQTQCKKRYVGNKAYRPVQHCAPKNILRF